MNILITGATGNLGHAVVDRFQTDNLIAITSVGKSSSLPKGVKGYEADLTQEAAVDEAISQILKAHITIDAAVLLVGGFTFGGIDQANGEEVKKMFDMNFHTAYFVARPIFQYMAKQKNGRIVLVGARPALDAHAGKNTVAYALSKSLIFTLAELLNAEGADKNVVTSVVVPSIIDTPVNRDAMPKADFSKWVKPEEIADTIATLISEKSKSLREPIVKIYGSV
ncbi:SDR family NAD(P)-dependent oxidoreductase [Pseudochryseolinea flava]|uniref:Short-chain dehydrogenase n=1 Tax=Pseudochryseolinea flava TaxID=2059302 RepID=A0A364XZN7_9BACT|nr:SDR family NAD(P)-dependent oxidoreductase [Pseudochryseolinea flava]RAV99465.1 hypothetical protein DQQ10_19815 [Pseudochryseolinea flava]